MGKVKWVAVVGLGLWCLAGVLRAANVTSSITAGQLTVSAPTDVTLTWTTTGAGRCLAGGDWSGAKNVIGGSETIRVTRTMTFNLSCESPTGPAKLRWTAALPQNTDGTAATIKGYQLFSGLSASQLTRLQTVTGASTTSADVQVPPGTTFFSVRSIRSDDIESVDAPGDKSKLVVADKATSAVTIVFEARPLPPTNLVVE